MVAIALIAALRDIAVPWLTTSSVSDLETLRDLCMFLLATGMMTAFGVSPGALFRAQVPTVAGVVVWALAIEGIITVIKPRIGIYLPFAAFQQLTMGGSLRVDDSGRAAHAHPARVVPGRRRLHRRVQRCGGLHLAAPRRHLRQPDRAPASAVRRRSAASSATSGAGALYTRVASSLSSW